MTFRTFDIDNGQANPETNMTGPSRHSRNRRRTMALSRRSSGARIVGFGF